MITAFLQKCPVGCKERRVLHRIAVHFRHRHRRDSHRPDPDIHRVIQDFVQMSQQIACDAPASIFWQYEQALQIAGKALPALPLLSLRAQLPALIESFRQSDFFPPYGVRRVKNIHPAGVNQVLVVELTPELGSHFTPAEQRDDKSHAKIVIGLVVLLRRQLQLEGIIFHPGGVNFQSIDLSFHCVSLNLTKLFGMVR